MSVKYLAALSMAVLLSSCSSTQPYNPANLSPEQLNALAKDKSGILSCTYAQSLAWTATNVFINFDMGRLDGVITVAAPCNITFGITRTTQEKP